MSNQIQVKNLFEQDNVKEKFREMLGKKASGFLVSVINTVQNNNLLQNADRSSILFAAATAASLDLPINENLGFAYIIPYNKKEKDGTYKQYAQFQLGYKGFIQLAQRSGQFQTIGSTPVYEGQIKEENPLTGYTFDWSAKKSEKIIGYAAYFKLINGFEKTLYMTVDELKAHGKSFSKTFQKGYGLWKDNFDAMAIKTVVKLILSKYAPLSIEMQRAQVADQAIIKDFEGNEIEYADNENETYDLKEVTDRKECERVLDHLENATIEEVEMLEESIDETSTHYQKLKTAIENKKESLTKKPKK